MTSETEFMMDLLYDEDEPFQFTNAVYLAHYGIKRRSGRYPYGSGEDPYQHSTDFLARYESYKEQKMTDSQIAEAMGFFGDHNKPSTTKLNVELSLAKNERRMLSVKTAERLRDKEGLSNSEIGRRMGVNESTVRSWFNQKSKSNMEVATNVAKQLKDRVDDKRMIDVGAGVERELNISKLNMDKALYLLEREGYHIYKGGIPQATNPNQQTHQVVLARPDVDYKEIYNYDQISTLKEYIVRDDKGTLEKKFNYPTSMDLDRLKIRYREEGGIDKDGMIELRRGVPDLSLGESHYAQVRILVDNDKYLKGMAFYGDDKDFPPGVDVIFNSNKAKGTDINDVLKKIKDDPENPFGSAIKDAEQGGQYWYNDPKTGERKLGLINKRADEGDWDEWSNGLPAQFLSKQSESLIKRQLGLAKKDMYDEYDEILKITNPTVKKALLQEFSSNCDSAAVHLKAAALPGQKYHVMLGFPSMPENQVYAPNYPNGTKLALVRYPHGGIFEIPVLTVNNNLRLPKKVIGNHSVDAIGINNKIGEQLSGADFDGDTVMAIPTDDPKTGIRISRTAYLDELKGFEPKDIYGPSSYEGRKIRLMKNPETGANNTQNEMGSISNLITDMTLLGAPTSEIARAVKHSMVVIDAAKHKLDYKQSELDNDIASLRAKWQPKYDKQGRFRPGGAATIISKAKGQETVLKRQGTPKINDPAKPWYDPSRPEGALIYKVSDDLYYPDRKFDKQTGIVTIKKATGGNVTYNMANKEDADRYKPVKRTNPETGEVYFTDRDETIVYKTKSRTQKSTKMLETDDAYTLVSKARNPKELAYAEYANSMKALANRARMEMVNTGKIEYSKAMRDKYIDEVKSLEQKLNDAKMNSVKERQANRIANASVKDKIDAGQLESKSDIKKARQKAITNARIELGTKTRRERNIDITDKEWEAIQAGAISETKLRAILANADMTRIRELATPRSSTQLSAAKIAKIKSYASANGSVYTIEQIASQLGVSASTVRKYLKPENKAKGA